MGRGGNVTIFKNCQRHTGTWWFMMVADPFRRMMEQMEDRFKELENTFKQFDKEFGGDLRSNRPAVDVVDRDNEILVAADLPGVEKDRIEINATDTSVAITARDDREIKEEGKDYVRQERSVRNYRRRVTLPARVDPDTAEATYSNGVLTVTLQKTKDAGKRIDVN